ncbi:hypothetical protein PPERSA_08854 [Pseudocohnilembus persalinus]|uniref:Uncharacterized protein n=1 Tax=Pseudocohnilembus persalinus TaxID=266149 RepID=A0A0V0R3S8_PSEPJ|nr:hypothetical protein PPERSA_08854 [Pseudocohnilembus persalinus]|eukprot:KRX09138.1 hypothetical protein PPERSA_08854 [Pseudocohnilembus persalinus]
MEFEQKNNQENINQQKVEEKDQQNSQDIQQQLQQEQPQNLEQNEGNTNQSQQDTKNIQDDHLKKQVQENKQKQEEQNTKNTQNEKIENNEKKIDTNQINSNDFSNQDNNQQLNKQNENKNKKLNKNVKNQKKQNGFSANNNNNLHFKSISNVNTKEKFYKNTNENENLNISKNTNNLQKQNNLSQSKLTQQTLQKPFIQSQQVSVIGKNTPVQQFEEQLKYKWHTKRINNIQEQRGQNKISKNYYNSRYIKKMAERDLFHDDTQQHLQSHRQNNNSNKNIYASTSYLKNDTHNEVFKTSNGYQKSVDTKTKHYLQQKKQQEQIGTLKNNSQKGVNLDKSNSVKNINKLEQSKGKNQQSAQHIVTNSQSDLANTLNSGRKMENSLKNFDEAKQNLAISKKLVKIQGTKNEFGTFNPTKIKNIEITKQSKNKNEEIKKENQRIGAKLSQIALNQNKHSYLNDHIGNSQSQQQSQTFGKNKSFFQQELEKKNMEQAKRLEKILNRKPQFQHQIEAPNYPAIRPVKQTKYFKEEKRKQEVADQIMISNIVNYNQQLKKEREENSKRIIQHQKLKKNLSKYKQLNFEMPSIYYPLSVKNIDNNSSEIILNQSKIHNKSELTRNQDEDDDQDAKNLVTQIKSPIQKNQLKSQKKLEGKFSDVQKNQENQEQSSQKLNEKEVPEKQNDQISKENQKNSEQKIIQDEKNEELLNINDKNSTNLNENQENQIQNDQKSENNQTNEVQSQNKLDQSQLQQINQLQKQNLESVQYLESQQA